ncbi:MAG: hypothetical protein J3K34DRAFT_460704 [Monoraphidium minutum]|nr:MAG: hypothetical protein J3K34DRAFT_460704 [Monoraphidium minutum]
MGGYVEQLLREEAATCADPSLQQAWLQAIETGAWGRGVALVSTDAAHAADRAGGGVISELERLKRPQLAQECSAGTFFEDLPPETDPLAAAALAARDPKCFRSWALAALARAVARLRAPGLAGLLRLPADARIAVARALLHAATCHYYTAASAAEAWEEDDDEGAVGGAPPGGWAAVHWPYEEPCCEPLFAALSPAHQWWLISDVLAALWAPPTPAPGSGGGGGGGGGGAVGGGGCAVRGVGGGSVGTPLHGAALLALAQLAGIHALQERAGELPLLLLETRVAAACASLPGSNALLAAFAAAERAGGRAAARRPDGNAAGRGGGGAPCGLLFVKRGAAPEQLDTALAALRRLHLHGLLAAPAAGHLAGAFGLLLLEPLWRVLQSAWAAAGADGGAAAAVAAAPPPQTLADLGALLAGALEGCGGGGEHGGGDGDDGGGSLWGDSSGGEEGDAGSGGGGSCGGAQARQQQEGRDGAEAGGRLEATLEVLTGGLLAQLRRDARAAGAPACALSERLSALQRRQLALLARLPQLLAAGGGSASSGGGGGGRRCGEAIAAEVQGFLQAAWEARAQLLVLGVCAEAGAAHIEGSDSSSGGGSSSDSDAGGGGDGGTSWCPLGFRARAVAMRSLVLECCHELRALSLPGGDPAAAAAASAELARSGLSAQRALESADELEEEAAAYGARRRGGAEAAARLESTAIALLDALAAVAPAAAAAAERAARYVGLDAAAAAAGDGSAEARTAAMVHNIVFGVLDELPVDDVKPVLSRLKGAGGAAAPPVAPDSWRRVSGALEVVAEAGLLGQPLARLPPAVAVAPMAWGSGGGDALRLRGGSRSAAGSEAGGSVSSGGGDGGGGGGGGDGGEPGAAGATSGCGTEVEDEVVCASEDGYASASASDASGGARAAAAAAPPPWRLGGAAEDPEEGRALGGAESEGEGGGGREEWEEAGSFLGDLRDTGPRRALRVRAAAALRRPAGYDPQGWLRDESAPWAPLLEGSDPESASLAGAAGALLWLCRWCAPAGGANGGGAGGAAGRCAAVARALGKWREEVRRAQRLQDEDGAAGGAFSPGDVSEVNEVSRRLFELLEALTPVAAAEGGGGAGGDAAARAAAEELEEAMEAVAFDVRTRRGAAPRLRRARAPAAPRPRPRARMPCACLICVCRAGAAPAPRPVPAPAPGRRARARTTGRTHTEAALLAPLPAKITILCRALTHPDPHPCARHPGGFHRALCARALWAPRARRLPPAPGAGARAAGRRAAGRRPAARRGGGRRRRRAARRRQAAKQAASTAATAAAAAAAARRAAWGGGALGAAPAPQAGRVCGHLAPRRRGGRRGGRRRRRRAGRRR